MDSGIEVEVHSDAQIRRREVDAARRAIAAVDRYVDEPVLGARLTLRRISPKAARPYVADATVLLDGRLVAAHAAGRDPKEAAEAAADRLRRQIRRLVGADVAQRNEPRAIREALESCRPSRCTGRRPTSSGPRSAGSSGACPTSTCRCRRSRPWTSCSRSTSSSSSSTTCAAASRSRCTAATDGRIGLLFPPGSVLADENDILVPQPSRYDRPLTLSEARAGMDIVNHRFVYFVDAGDALGKVIYLRHDGDYGLVARRAADVTDPGLDPRPPMPDPAPPIPPGPEVPDPLPPPPDPAPV